MNDKKRPRLLMIGLDAGEPRLIEKWTADGSLPNIQRLREAGLYGRMASSAKWMAGSPWPTFFTGTTPADHGLYHYMHWRPEEMTIARPTPDWLPLQPFWESFGPGDPRVVVIDVPTTYAPQPFNGLGISGYATHDRPGAPDSYPSGLMDWVQQEFGPSPIKPEVYGRQPVTSLLKLRDRLNQATESVVNLAESLMTAEDWDLFIVTFGATHSGGHKLWDRTGAADEADRDYVEFDRALKEVYMTCDQAAGRLAAKADENTTIIVFSVHGMGANESRVDLLPEMLDRILNDGEAEGLQAEGVSSSKELDPQESDPQPGAQKTGLLTRLRMAVPLEWRSNVKSRLPTFLQDRLTAFWLLRNVDWSTVRAFAMAGADLQGYIRFNLAGREAEGIVRPEEAAQLEEAITTGLLTFVDADTDRPVVAEVKRPDEIYGRGARLDELPDLIIRWDDSPLSEQRAIVSDRYGEIGLSAPGYNPNGRSGNHRPEGFLIAAGPGIEAGAQLDEADILDLAPTVCALLGVPVPEKMVGRVLFERMDVNMD
jgi:predicted AlkP superfamily phosphohydrolase/phosphomutase